MRLKKVTGCICDSLTADGIEEIDMTPEQRKEVIDKICDWLKKNPDQLNYVMQDFIETFADDCKHDPEPCECCGDTVYTWTWDI
jgi:hypothetical protein